MEDHTVATGRGETKFIAKKFTYTWNIEKPTIWPSKFSSPTFSFDGHIWSLELQPISSLYPARTSLYILLESDPSPEVYASVTCSMNGITGQTVSACFKKLTSHGFPNFCENGYINNFNNFNIICELNVLYSIGNGIQTKKNDIKIPKNQISYDLGNILDNGKYNDVILAVNDQEIKAHKAILAGRSAVFAAMFEHEMLEKQLNRVKIDDMEVEVLKEMLHFIYTGEAPNLKNMSSALLAAADKYALENLKVMCESELSLNLAVETAAETLILADLYSAEQLKKSTLNYFKMHAKDIMTTEGWKNLTESHTHLTPAILCLILK